MKTFQCSCENRLYFENTQCLRCNESLGFLEDLRFVSPIEKSNEDLWRAGHPAARDRLYRKCHNYADAAVCNWMVPGRGDAVYCRSCRLNQIIPDLSDQRNVTLWRRIERAKRQLVDTLLELDLPIIDRNQDPEKGLAFKFLADPDTGSEFYDHVGRQSSVMTGHLAGTITINIAEADPAN